MNALDPLPGERADPQRRRLQLRGLGALTVGALVVACSGSELPPAEVDPNAYAAELDAWQEERIASLTAPDGWLSLVGLFWLQPGENVLRLAEENAAPLEPGEAPPDVVLLPLPALVPEGVEAGATLGSIVVEAAAGVPEGEEAGMTAHFVPNGDEGPVISLVSAAGAVGAVIGRPLRLAATGDAGPTTLALGSLRAFLIERGGDFALRVRDVESSRRGLLTEIERFPVDPSWRLTGRFEAEDEVREIAVPNATGRSYAQMTLGKVVFEHDGAKHALVVLGSDPDAEQLLVVADETGATESYPGGRYIYVDISNPDEIALDFNRLYNPPCVFSPHATCPLPPRGNRLPFRVEAGEKWVHLSDMEH